ncbi:amidase [Streptomyces filamentosus NRRL 15998]|uniref:N-acetylmuramoyl-L-alanine amidase n=1 Tax=Streptomyces filamentosus NRRL 15998 TaxID=457431 RepID=D6AL81_STRFL|nr:amidase [Streptomyces filamentosus NRRL 15998]
MRSSCAATGVIDQPGPRPVQPSPRSAVAPQKDHPVRRRDGGCGGRPAVVGPGRCRAQGRHRLRDGPVGSGRRRQLHRPLPPFRAPDRPCRHPRRPAVVHADRGHLQHPLQAGVGPLRGALRASEDQQFNQKDIAWHAGNWSWNTRSIGIEHEGWVDRPEFFTDVMYLRSAGLTADICDRHGIPKDREHIVGHHEVPGSDHTDPGVHWDWERYLRLVRDAD